MTRLPKVIHRRSCERSHVGTIFFLTHSAVYPFKPSRCELQSFGIISRRDVCLLSNMELDGAWLVVLKVPKNTMDKLNSNVSFQKS